ncbi:hypothetical protein M422DRAFT_209254 [Sphaerobolus stellatus SS14]|uniref:Cytochrome P450 n=1 Tax=Sphaerobolus stellatus (strain SS14) TaxID=990650 RepID=A0A0C9VSU2_SPHS4|nr:hypothetical protein M422DRAFT_209254 [Sphaerobolus stellatus SS14]
MLHDPEVYADPMEFKPERYNNDDTEMQKINDLVFGFGRRACPGSHFAFGTLYSIVLTTLATCDILPALDANGKEIIPNVKYSSGTISFPDKFPLRLRSRSPKAEALLAEVSTAPE